MKFSLASTGVVLALLSTANPSQALRLDQEFLPRGNQIQLAHTTGHTRQDLTPPGIITIPGQTTAQKAACQPLRIGSGPRPRKDTAPAFMASREIRRIASNAETPDGYARMFANLQASGKADGHMCLAILEAYDPAACAALCTADEKCLAFNIFFQRTPTVELAEACRTSPSTTLIKCMLWGTRISTDDTVYTGQMIFDFEVAVAGSNGYVKNAIG